MKACIDRKGQVWSFDFIASVTIFFMVLMVLFFVWEYTTLQNNDQIVFNDMESTALDTIDTMIRVRGFPEQWDSSNVEVLGLASEENVLNESKLLEFVSMDYYNSRRVLGILGYGFYFQVLNLNDTQAYSGSTALLTGADPLASSATAIVPVERYVLFDHKVAKVRFTLWY